MESTVQEPITGFLRENLKDQFECPVYMLPTPSPSHSTLPHFLYFKMALSVYSTTDQSSYGDDTGLDKKFDQIVPWDNVEKPKWAFWPAQYNGQCRGMWFI